MSNPITPLTPEQFAAQEAKAAKEGYVERVLVGAVDEPINVLTDGLPDETISSRAARLAVHGKGIGRIYGVAMSRFLDFFQPDHGAKAEAGDTIRGIDVMNTEDAADGE